MNPPAERTLADKQNEIVRAWLKPFGDGLSEKARLSVANHQRFRESLDPRPADEIEELLGELRQLKPEDSKP